MQELTLIVKLTNQCNLDCVYCFDKQERQKEKTFLTEKQIMVAAEKVLLNADQINWIWHGGEPGVYGFEKIVDLTNKIRQLSNRYYSSINFSLQTNGSLLTEEVIKLLNKNNISFGVSYDGINQIKNRNANIVDSAFENTSGIISIINPEDNIVENYNFLKQKGIKKIALNMKFPIKQKITNWKEFINYYFADKNPLVEKNILGYVSKVVDTNDHNTCDWDKFDNILTVRSDGQLCYCDIDDKYVFGDFTSTDKMLLEDYFKTEQYREYLNKKLELKQHCLETCFLSDICSGCFARIGQQTEVSDDELDFCEIRRQIYLYIKTLLQTPEKIKNPFVLALIKDYHPNRELENYYDLFFND